MKKALPFLRDQYRQLKYELKNEKRAKITSFKYWFYKILLKRPNICTNCAKTYDHSLSSHTENGITYCRHDSWTSIGTLKFDHWEQKNVVEKLKPNEIAVKGDDGMVRIMEGNRKK